MHQTHSIIASSVFDLAKQYEAISDEEWERFQADRNPDRLPTHFSVMKIASELGREDFGAVFDEFALEIAILFHDKNFSYEICSNLIREVWHEKNIDCPIFRLGGELTHEIFMAFDDVAWHKKSTAPIERFLVPEIRQILERHQKTQ